MSSQSAPLVLQERLRSLDFIRGIAVLGILMMNIQAFSMPFAAYANPTNFGDLTGINYWSWYLSHLFFDQKFMSIFSILFGVGILIFSERADAKEGHSGKRHYIRMFWLFVFGMIHAYFIWWGDILVAYSLSGALAYLFRNVGVKALAITGFSFILLVSLFQLLQGFALPHMSEKEIADNILVFWSPGEEAIGKEVAAYSGTWLEAFHFRVSQAIMVQTFTLLYIFKILGLNLIGMALYKSNFFRGSYRRGTYLFSGLMLVIIGTTLTGIGATYNIESNFSWQFSIAYGIQFNYWGSTFSALGYMSLLMWMSQNIETNFFKRSMAKVGQMAFTNYILQSLICTTIIYGYGLNLYGKLERFDQVLFTFAVWMILLIFSSVWLSRFRFGPLEKVWRALTYGKVS
ncbi:DUF418 domain-containing protein [Pleionea sediminis]|uniref:DUF418 domain-containing protein n=1 Tax=Pleionea sediminis TaxID=2569479 RepID=UPI00118715D2|nr:DUF418 domain-containing protein [Pleionea sediminis]